jgi:hypothetical protein
MVLCGMQTKGVLMPMVHTHYRTYVSRGRRHHQHATAPEIAPSQTTNVQDGGQYEVWTGTQITWNNNGSPETDGFMFWAVTGAADGSHVVSDQDLKVKVGSADVEVTGWYLPPGTGVPNGGGPGLWIDAFDVDLGDFSDADFVDVISDPTLTAAANEEGFVPTGAADEDVRAYTNVDGVVPFTDWEIFMPDAGVTIAGHDLLGQMKHNSVAFAFYQTPVSAPPTGWHGLGREYEAGTWVSAGVKVDAGGPTGRGPVPPWNPYLRDLETGLVMAEAARFAKKSIRAESLELAAKQISYATHKIGEQMMELAAHATHATHQ